MTKRKRSISKSFVTASLVTNPDDVDHNDDSTIVPQNKKKRPRNQFLRKSFMFFEDDEDHDDFSKMTMMKAGMEGQTTDILHLVLQFLELTSSPSSHRNATTTTTTKQLSNQDDHDDELKQQVPTQNNDKDHERHDDVARTEVEESNHYHRQDNSHDDAQNLFECIQAIVSHYDSDQRTPEMISSSSLPTSGSPTKRSRSLLSRYDVAGVLLPWTLSTFLRCIRMSPITLASPLSGTTMNDDNNNNNTNNSNDTKHLSSASSSRYAVTKTTATVMSSSFKLGSSIPLVSACCKAFLFCLETLLPSSSPSTTTGSSTNTTTLSLSRDSVRTTSSTACSSISSCLTQSHLHKLIPWTMRLVFVNALEGTSTTTRSIVDADDDLKYIRELAGQAYCLLVDHFYRPTLDVACTNLLIPIAMAVNHNHQHEQHHSHDGNYVNCRHDASALLHNKMIRSTLRLFLKMLDSMGNPKKNFTTMAASPSLMALAILHHFMAETQGQAQSDNTVSNHNKDNRALNHQQKPALKLPSEEDDPSTPTVVPSPTNVATTTVSLPSLSFLFRQVIEKAWFQSSVHMEGFRSLNRSMDCISLSTRDDTSQPISTSPLPAHEQECRDSPGHPQQKQPPHEGSLKSENTSVRTFHCYQESLFDSIQTLLMVDIDRRGEQLDDDAGSPLTQRTDQIYLVRLLPLLLEVFVEQSKKYCNNQPAHGSGNYPRHNTTSNTTDLSDLQFLVWGHLMISPLRWTIQAAAVTAKPSSSTSDVNISSKSLNARMHLACLQTIREGLQLLVQHQIYRPSHYDDDGEEKLTIDHHHPQQQHGKQKLSKQEQQPRHAHRRQCVALLRQLVQVLQDDHDKVVTTFSAWVSPQSHRDDDHAVEIMQILCNITKLNHRLIHDRLDRLLILAALWYRNVTAKYFVTTIILTYNRLRQMDHLVSSILLASSSIPQEAVCVDKDGRHSSVSLLLKDTEVASKLAEAFENCPLNQVRTLFELLSQTLIKETSAQNTVNIEKICDSNKIEIVSSSVLVMVLLFRNVRVDQYTSSKVIDLCDRTMDGAVASLLLRDDDDPHYFLFTKHGLMLCGWALDLHLRCAFWQNDGTAASHFNSTSDISQMSPSFKKAMELLKKATSLPEQNTEKDNSISLLNELHFLASYRIQHLHSQIYESNRVDCSNKESVNSHYTERHTATLIDEAKTLAGFFIDAAQRESSLDGADSPSKWTRTAKAVAIWTPYAEIKHRQAFLKWLFSTLSFASGDCSIDEEENIVKKREEMSAAFALIADASFYELPFASDLYAIGLKCFVELSEIIFHGLQPNAQFLVEGKYFFTKPLPSQFDVDELLKLLRRGRRVACDEVSRNINLEVQNNICRALGLLDILQRLPISLTPARVNEEHIVKLILLDVSVDIVLKQSPYCDLKTSMLKMLVGIRKLLSNCFSLGTIAIQLDPKVLCCLIAGLVRSSTEGSAIGNDVSHALLRVTGELARTLIRYSVNFGQSFFRDLMDDLGQIIRYRKADMANPLACILTARYLVCGLKSIRFDDGGDLIILIDEIRKSIWDTLAHFALSTEVGPVRAECLLLMGELLQVLPFGRGEALQNNLELIAKVVSRHLREPCTQSAAFYLVACLDAHGIDLATKLRMATDIITLPWDTSSRVQEAALSALSRDVHESELRRFLDSVLSHQTNANLSPRSKVRFSHIFLPIRHPGHHQDLLAAIARNMFFTALGMLNPSSVELGSWDEDVAVAMISLVELCKAKEMMHWKEQELALILSKIHSVLNQSSDRKNQGVNVVPAKVYESSYVLLAALLQRFPKQLYNCVSCVVIALRSMLRHAQQLRGDQSIPDIIDRGQKFARLCEMLIPHKDIYKKHVLGLLIDFIDGLKEEMHPYCRKALLPAMFCLLDVLSQYETQQLNTLIDTTGKSLFRSVFQDYKSSHVYKGQY